ncbi:hypothetical protein LTR17_008827 [Elasticomyces elasticus]|nr:hypothetical protein LTR17_008827 [Elasticomyces elasticus]
MESASGSSGTQLDPTRESRHVAYIIHSSGSTSLPRPNYVTHLAALGNSSSPINLVGFVTLPIYHMFGRGCLFRIMNKNHVYMYNAHSPLSNRYLIDTLSAHQEIQVLYTVPYIVKLVAESTQGTDLLAGLTNVIMSGSACPKPIGDKLALAGVMLVTHLGSTETGQLMSSARPHRDILEWDWLRPSCALLPYLRMDAQADQRGIYELVVLYGWPSKLVSNRPDGSFATKDLYERHPDWPRRNAWRYYARKDDTIVLSTGEKANSLLLEGVAREDALVAEAVVFGTHKPHVGFHYSCEQCCKRCGRHRCSLAIGGSNECQYANSRKFFRERLMGFFAAKYERVALPLSKTYRADKLGSLPALKQIPVLDKSTVELQVRYLQSQWAHQTTAA